MPTWTPVPWTPHPSQLIAVRRLASFDALHQDDRLLGLGWAFLCGTTQIGGQLKQR